MKKYSEFQAEAAYQPPPTIAPPPAEMRSAQQRPTNDRFKLDPQKSLSDNKFAQAYARKNMANKFSDTASITVDHDRGVVHRQNDGFPVVNHINQGNMDSDIDYDAANPLNLDPSLSHGDMPTTRNSGVYTGMPIGYEGDPYGKPISNFELSTGASNARDYGRSLDHNNPEFADIYNQTPDAFKAWQNYMKANRLGIDVPASPDHKDFDGDRSKTYFGIRDRVGDPIDDDSIKSKDPQKFWGPRTGLEYQYPNDPSTKFNIKRYRR